MNVALVRVENQADSLFFSLFIQLSLSLSKHQNLISISMRGRTINLQRQSRINDRPRRAIVLLNGVQNNLLAVHTRKHINVLPKHRRSQILPSLAQGRKLRPGRILIPNLTAGVHLSRAARGTPNDHIRVTVHDHGMVLSGDAE